MSAVMVSPSIATIPPNSSIIGVVLQYVCGYGEESDVARNKHGSIESRLITAHEMLASRLRVRLRMSFNERSFAR